MCLTKWAPYWMIRVSWWLARHWKWLVLPVGVALWLLGRWSAPAKAAASSALPTEGESALADKLHGIDEEARIAKAEITVQTQQQIAGIEAAHSASVSAATRKQVTEAAEASGDSESVNALLLRVGKEQR